MKKTVYLDTSVISFLYDERDEFKFLKETTNEFWNNFKHKYELFTSSETLIELENGSFPNQKRMLDEVDNLKILDKNENIYNIAQFYLENKAMPQQLSGDAVHLAIASYYALNYLLTWNYKHLANVNKLQHIKILNARLELYTPYIITPLQLIGSEEDDNGI